MSTLITCDKCYKTYEMLDHHKCRASGFKSVESFPALRQDRRYRCEECGELCDPSHHEGAWNGDLLAKRDMRPVCPACESGW